MSTQQRFVLVGVHAGKTMSVNGREFVDGVFDYVGSPQEIINLTNLFSYYGAVTQQEAEMMALRSTIAEMSLQARPAEDLQDAADRLMAAELKALESPKPDLTVTPPDSPSGLPSLAEAIGALDPEADGDWTSSNLPSLDRLQVMTGSQPTRAAVEQIAAGYTRAKARSARGQ